MVSFFKNHDLIRLILVIIVLILIKLPVFFLGFPSLVPELLWQITGDKLADGILMYKGVFDTLEPFSAGTYYLLSLLNLNSSLSYQIIAMILVIVQALMFNVIISSNNLFPERNFLPALMYGIFSLMFIDFNTLSPILLGTTFLLLALHFIFGLIRSGDDEENIFYSGLLIGIASLFYFPFFVFLFLVLLSFLLFTPVSVRKYFVVLFAFSFPFLLTGTYYFLRDGLSAFIRCFSFSLFSDSDLLISSPAILLVCIVPIVYLVISFGVISVASRYINYQYVAIRVVALWLVFGVLSLYFAESITALQLYVFVPVLAFFTAHFFFLLKNKWIREGSFLILLIAVLWVNYDYLYRFSVNKIPASYAKMYVEEVKGIDIKGKRVLILGNDVRFYKNNSLATPFLNWRLSSQYFKDLNNYSNISMIYGELSSNMPELIIDEENIAPTLFSRIPQLGRNYTKSEIGPIYELKKEATNSNLNN